MKRTPGEYLPPVFVGGSLVNFLPYPCGDHPSHFVPPFSGLLKRSPFCNHLKHVAFSTPKTGGKKPPFTSRNVQVSSVKTPPRGLVLRPRFLTPHPRHGGHEKNRSRGSAHRGGLRATEGPVPAERDQLPADSPAPRCGDGMTGHWRHLIGDILVFDEG